MSVAGGITLSQRISTTDRVHTAIRDSIVAGQLPAGSMHSIYHLAEIYKVSRTPIRDAILRLADAGMVEIARNQGVRIRGLSLNDVREIIETRMLLEVPAAAQAARVADATLLDQLDATLAELKRCAAEGHRAEFVKHDRALHRILLEASGNRRLAALVETLRDSTQAMGISTMDVSRSLHEVELEHIPIVEAVRAGGAVAAAQLMQLHLATTGRLLMAQVATTSGEVLPDPWPGALVVAP